MMSRMDTPNSSADDRDRTGRGARTLALAIAFGLIAVAVLATVLVLRRPEDSGLARVEVILLEDRRGPGPGIPYVVELELSRDGYPVVMHVDADGLPSILYPFGSPVRLMAGERLRLPDPYGSVTWWTLRGPEAGSIVVAMSTNSPQSTERLLELAERAASRASSPEDARESVRRVMRDRLGPAVVARLDEGRARGG